MSTFSEHPNRSDFAWLCDGMTAEEYAAILERSKQENKRLTDISTARKAQRYLAERLGLSTAEEERARERADRVLQQMAKRAE